MRSILSVLSKVILPDDSFASIYDINLEYLRKNSIEAVIIDMDNTLIPRKDDIPSLRCLSWIDELKDAGIKICIASNNTNADRVIPVANYLDVIAVLRTLKPMSFIFKKIIRDILQVTPDKVLMVGDQFLTDIVGGNNAGFRTAYVEPCGQERKEYRKWFIKFDKKLYNFISNM